MKDNLFRMFSGVALLPFLASLSLPATAADDRTAVVPNLQIDILTGKDDLRGGNVGYAEIRLRDGRVLPKVNLNGGAVWGGSSSHSVTLPLPAGIQLGDLDAASVTISHDGAPRNISDSYDNWNVDRVRVGTPKICTNKASIVNISGRPWVRFTGSKTFATVPFRVPTTAKRTTPGALGIEILTGGDDLRGGSVAYAEIRLRNGTVLPKVNLNGGTSWGDNSSNSVSLPLPTGTQFGDLESLTLSQDGAPRNVFDSYDNWNVNKISVNTPEVCSEGISLANVSGRPWVRFTGGKTFKTFNLRVR